jgi:hypothetical protein
LVRLLGEAAGHGTDPELFAGLVHACRYCGLYEQSIAAHHEARRLDPHVPTSVEQTMLMQGEIERLAGDGPSTAAEGDDAIRVIALGLAGRHDEARQALEDLRRASQIEAFQTWADLLTAWLDRRPADMVAFGAAGLGGLRIMEDPEAVFQLGWLLCDAGDGEHGLDALRRAVANGYHVAPTLTGSRSFDALRDRPAFQALVADAEAGRARALAAFRDHGGERLLGR